MKYWEFLIQKEGDDTWLPLETHQVEILAGRYRVVAHSDRTNTPVNIRVAQLVIAADSPRQRVRSRTSQTNDAGLVAIIPYIYLRPGQWELTCSSQNVAGLDDWQYTVQLQVFAPAEENGAADWSPTGEAISADAKTHSLSNLDPLESSFVNPGLPLTQAQAHLQDSLLSSSGQSVENEAVYGISLRQHAFLAQADQPMVIVGQVQALANLSVDQGESQLWLRLQNPETTQVIMEAHRPINLARLPADFKVKIQLPAHVTTRVVFGEVSLRSALSETGTSGAVLSAAAFTITAGIAQLLDSVAKIDLSEFEEGEFEEGEFEEGVASQQGSSDYADSDYANEVRLEDGSLSVAIPPFEADVHAVSPAVGVMIPPQLYHTAEQTNGQTASADLNSRIDLPNFLSSKPLIVSDPPQDKPRPNSHPVASSPAEATDANEDSASSGSTRPHAVKLPPMVAKPAQFMSTSIEDDDLETAQIAALLEDINSDLETIAPPSESSSASRSSSFLSTTPDEPSDDSPDEPAPSTKPDNPYHRRTQKQASARAAFRTLKLKDHFMQRLSNLTHDEINQATKFAEDLQAADVMAASSQAFSQPDALSNSEVVIFDEPPAVEDTPATPVTIPVDSAPSPLVPPSLPAASVTTPSVLPPLPAPPTRPHRQRYRQDPRQTQRQPQGQLPNVEGQPDESQSQPQSLIPSQPQSPIPSQPQSQRLFPQPAANSPTPPLTDSDRNRQLRLERLRQRQAEAKAARGESLPPSAEPPVQPSVAASSAAGALVRQSSEDELPEMVLPIISVPMGDLVAGDRVTITVRTRPSVFRPFIKLWMIDRQSRTVVGEPKLLTDLRPDALGDLQTSTELLVPMDCLDVQIAAIAIDMATQQESNKAIVNRHVIPPVQSLPQLRNFQEREWHS